jgi:hypothetical protein
MYTPTLLSEHAATSEAKRVLGEKPKGLGSAYLTYTLPAILAGIYGLGAYGVGRKARNKPLLPFMKESEAYLAGFMEKCAIAGFYPEQLLRQRSELRKRPNIDEDADQGRGPVPAPEEGGTFNTPAMPQKDAPNRKRLGRLSIRKKKQAKNTKEGQDYGTDAYGMKGEDFSTPGLAGMQPSPAMQPSPTNAQVAGPPKPYASIIAQAVQALQRQTKATPGPGSLGQTAAGQAVQGNQGALANVNPATAVQDTTTVTT